MSADITNEMGAAAPLRVLVVEDSARDAELVVREIRRSYPNVSWQRVESSVEMREALAGGKWDIVVSDFSLPQFDGLAALNLLRENHPDTPFVIVSGEIGEETAIAAMRAGAQDFVMKDKLARLRPAIDREMRDAQARRERRLAREEIRAALYGIADGVITTGPTGRITRMNPAAEAMTGWTEQEALGRQLSEVFRVTKGKVEDSDTPFERMASGNAAGACQTVLVARDGTRRPIADTGAPIRGAEGDVIGMALVFRDQSAEMEARSALQDREAFGRAVLDAVGANIAVLDRSGLITAVNQAWEDFARDNACPDGGSCCMTGVDYFSAWTRGVGGEEGADEAMEGVRRVLAGELSSFSCEYPCHSPDIQRWFMLQVTPLSADAGGGAVLAHINITHRKLAEARATEAFKETQRLLKGAEQARQALLSIMEDRRKAEEALRESEDRFRTLFENSSAIMLLLDPETQRIVDANKAAAAYYGYPVETLRAMRISDINTLSPEQIQAEIGQALAQKRLHFLFRHRRADGEVRDVEIYTNPVRVGERPLLHSIIHDVTDRLKAERAVMAHARQQQAVADLGQQAIATTALPDLMRAAVDTVSRTLDAEFCEILQIQSDGNELVQVAGIGWPEEVGGHMALSAAHDTQAGLALSSAAPVIVNDMVDETRFRGAQDLLEFGVRAGISVVIPGRGSAWGVLGVHTAEPRVFSENDAHFLASVANVIAEATFRSDAEERIRHDALHDALTGLPNRTLLTDRISLAFNRFGRSSHDTFALLLMDLDRFKNVNDTLGHMVGDQVLLEVARRLQSAARGTDTVARLGGDEFAILIEDIDAESSSTRVAQRLLAVMRLPLMLDDVLVEIGATIGIVVVTGDHTSAADVIRDADIALHRAKAEARGGYQVFDRAMHHRVLERMELERELRHAIQRDEMRLVLQPIVSLSTGRIVSFEALLRWHHPDRGLVPPGLFIPIAEETGLILRIGEWVTREACSIIRDWPAGGTPSISINASPAEIFDARPAVSVNQSAQQVRAEGVDERIARIARDEGVDPGFLRVEITEGVMIRDRVLVGNVLQALVARGFRLLLDDFGAGYSSLAYLQDFPFYQVKLDGGFTAALAPGNRTHNLLRGIIGLAHSIGLEVVAEGVETPDQLALLRGAGCDHAQGYHISRPLPVDEAQRLYASGRTW